MSVFAEIRCPIETCYGWVSEVEENKDSLFYGCGNCGNIWKNKSTLFESVRSISKKYPYRVSVYLASNDGFTGVSLKEEPEDYDELVTSEWDNI